MSRIIIIAAAALVCAIVIGTSAFSLSHPASPNAAAQGPSVSAAQAPAASIDVFELMGRALGELPVEQADMN